MQKEKLIETTRSWSYLKYYTKCFDEFCKDNVFVSSRLIHNLESFCENALVTLTQLNVLLQTCPENINSAAKAVEIPILLHENEDFPHIKHNAAWKKATELIKEAVTLVQKLYSVIEKHNTNIRCVEYKVIQPSYIGFADVNCIVKNIDTLTFVISDIENVFGDIPISSSLKWLREEAVTLNKSLEDSNNEEPSSTNKSTRLVEILTENMLFAVQGIYKKYSSQVELELKDTEEESEEAYILYDGHLKVLITENLCDDVAILEMKSVLTAAAKVAKTVMIVDPTKNRNLQAILSRAVPLLEQLTLLYEYFITQQVSAYRVTCKMSSILLNIFIELLSKVSMSVLNHILYWIRINI